MTARHGKVIIDQTLDMRFDRTAERQIPKIKKIVMKDQVQ